MSSQRRFTRKAKRAPRPQMQVLAQGERVRYAQPTFTLTREEAAVLEAVTAQDKRYFEEHPHEWEYDRPAVSGEVPRAQMDDLRGYRVKVSRIMVQGARSRAFYKPDEHSPRRPLLAPPLRPERN